MNENILMENPLGIFDEFKTLPNEAFDYDKESIISIIDSVIESNEYKNTVTKILRAHPEKGESNLKELKKEKEKVEKNIYTGNRAEVIDYFMTKAIRLIEEIQTYDGAFSYVDVKILPLDENVKLPTYSTYGDACMDIYSNVDVTIKPGDRYIVKTGFKLIVPGGYEMQIRPRSGMSYKTSVRIPNTPGTIDSGYRDEVGVILENIGSNDYVIHKGDRIAQMKLSEVPKINWNVISEEEYNKYSTNRGSGFGSSGV